MFILNSDFFNHICLGGVDDNRLTSWEIDYCNSVRVPWRKILASKKYIYCYPSVLNWDASAGEEALQNAKQRYWAMINGLPCDNPLPDPDMYIGEIDWNPYMDPELMADLDLQFPIPEEEQKVEKLETINDEVELAQAHYNKNKLISDNPWETNHIQSTGTDSAQGWGRWDEFAQAHYNKNQATSDNPWESNHVQSTGRDLAQGWGGWDDSVNLKNDNPWEKSCSQPVDSLKDNVWGNGNESGGWYQGTDNNRSSAFINYRCGNSSNNNRQTVAVSQEWAHRENNSWSWSHGNAEGLKNKDSCGYSCENNYSIGSKDRGWGDNRNDSLSWRCNQNESWGWRGNQNESRGWRGNQNESFRGGCRKRENSVQHMSKYKSSRYHGDTYRDSKQF